ncbi:MAG: hypothetical protein AABX24_03340 [Nanoarchaeota archaeon]
MKDKIKQLSFWAGIVIVVGAHLYMLFIGLPANQQVAHSIMNLVAAGLFAYYKFA